MQTLHAVKVTEQSKPAEARLMLMLTMMLMQEQTKQDWPINTRSGYRITWVHRHQVTGDTRSAWSITASPHFPNIPSGLSNLCRSPQKADFLYIKSASSFLYSPFLLAGPLAIMKFLSAATLLLTAPLISAASFPAVFDPSQASLHADSNEDIPVPGTNPLKYCQNPSNYLIEIDSVDLVPNPPQPYVPSCDLTTITK